MNSNVLHYGKDIRQRLESMWNHRKRTSWILIELINPTCAPRILKTRMGRCQREIWGFDLSENRSFTYCSCRSYYLRGLHALPSCLVLHTPLGIYLVEYVSLGLYKIWQNTSNSHNTQILKFNKNINHRSKFNRYFWTILSFPQSFKFHKENFFKYYWNVSL